MMIHRLSTFFLPSGDRNVFFIVKVTAGENQTCGYFELCAFFGLFLSWKGKCANTSRLVAVAQEIQKDI